MYLKPFDKWKSNMLFEDIASAKSFLKKKAAKELGIDPKQLTPEQEKEIYDKDLKVILNIIGNHHGYAYAFIKFKEEHGATVQQLKELLDILSRKKYLVSELPMSILQYANLEKEGELTGFEKLNDALRTIERNKEAKWLIERFPKKLRDEFKTLDAEKKTEVYNAAHTLTQMEDEITRRLLEKIKAMSQWSIDDLIDYIRNYLKAYSNTQMTKMVKDVSRLEPAVGILYADEKYLALSVRTESAQKKLCAVANWCLNRGSWQQYTKQAVQLNIFDFGVPATDAMFLTGTTIDYDGKVTASHDINDANLLRSFKDINGKTKVNELQRHLSNLGYPDKMISQILRDFDTEVNIKKLVSKLNIDAENASKMLTAITTTSYHESELVDAEASQIVIQIILDRIKEKITPKEVAEFYLEKGVLNLFSAKIFKELSSFLKTEENRKIIENTKSIFDELRQIAQEDPKLISAQIQKILDDEGEVLKELGI